MITDFGLGSIVTKLSQGDVSSVLKEWEEVFCLLSKSEKREINYYQYMWHVFSFQKYAFLEGEEALDFYKQQVAREYYILSESKEEGYIIDELPLRSWIAKGKDVYVSPKNLAWTMVFTHEGGYCGPYFAKHPDFLKLGGKNRMSVEAKRKGW